MKSRFNSFDVAFIVAELQKLVGMRVDKIYDVNNKTYLIKLHKGEEKTVLLIESGTRVHLTNFEWPKNLMPSGFSMKLRKHLKNKRIEEICQIERDRIVKFKLGSREAAYFVVVEMFDRGNIILTDYSMKIVAVLRPHVEEDKIKFAIDENYPETRAKKNEAFDIETLKMKLEPKQGHYLKKALLPLLDYGLPLLEHVLLNHNMEDVKVGRNFDVNNTSHMNNLLSALFEAENLFVQAKAMHLSKGYIIYSIEKASFENPLNKNCFSMYNEFHPHLFSQHKLLLHQEFETFNSAVDEFYSKVESQKRDLQSLKQEQEAMKKLEKIRRGYSSKLESLENEQMNDMQKAELISGNQKLVDDAILIVRAALANQIPWDEIDTSIKSAAAKNDNVAKHIKQLKLEINSISLFLEDPCSFDNMDTDLGISSMVVDIDLGLSAYSNATRYYDRKRTASKKQQKTVESQEKVVKSAEKKTKDTMKKVQTVSNIQKVRKMFWFEKFLWFVSSENFLVIGGRDQQQNELIVKRYLKPKDVYVHADIHGASSVVIKNPKNLMISPKTLIEAGTAAICYSVAWEAKVVPSSYWVWGDQVSKSAPTGEYLSTGSFIVRGKKNFLPPLKFVLGLGILFRMEDSCIEKHKDERKEPQEIDYKDTAVGTKDEDIFRGTFNNRFENIGYEDDDDYNKTDNKILNDQGTGNQTLGREIVGKKFFTSTTTVAEAVVNVKIYDNEIIVDGDAPNQNESKLEPNQKESKLKLTGRDKEKINKAPKIKRGQKGKMKKISEKYKDQDEEERMLRMDILQSAGGAKEEKRNKKNKSTKLTSKKNPVSAICREPVFNSYEKDIKLDDVMVQDDVDIIHALTGKPFPDDELLFAVPVVAPYNSLLEYKYKVKLSPGSTKRGKLGKIALGIFLSSKNITIMEKNLLQAIKEDHIVKNFPGKGKISCPGLTMFKK